MGLSMVSSKLVAAPANVLDTQWKGQKRVCEREREREKCAREVTKGESGNHQNGQTWRK